MTRKDYRLLAAALRDTRDTLPADNLGPWRLTVVAIADALSADSGYDLNGNRRFDRERFYAAAGMVDR